ncbi:MAG: hypothetical protein IJS38_00640 [Erysipelotrichaceae bacterium]|nr:hypothetical protein [Erysipelotrichaceae bacterium]MBQ4252845.1 hypothetical protein [Erysipelotrichaceae bacterium]MBQ7223061.1 hypothetical protein [Erysipelotrichaceae bacterium]
MLEGTNDYMSILAILLVLVAFVVICIHVVSLRVTARHLRQEADYYAFRRKR